MPASIAIEPASPVAVKKLLAVMREPRLFAGFGSPFVPVTIRAVGATIVMLPPGPAASATLPTREPFSTSTMGASSRMSPPCAAEPLFALTCAS